MKKHTFALTPFEALLKEWYHTHGDYMPIDLFLIKEKQVREHLTVTDRYCSIDPCYQDYQNATYHRMDAVFDLKDIPMIFSNEFVLVLRQPRYFPLAASASRTIEISYMYSGSCRVCLSAGASRKDWELRQGDFLFTPSGLNTLFYVDSDDAIVINFVLSQKAFAEMLPYNLNFQQEILYQTGTDAEIDYMVDKIIDEAVDKKANYRKVIFLLFSLMIAHLERNYTTSNMNRKIKRYESYIPAFSEYIKEHYADFSLRSMAKAFSLSEAHISRLYRQYTGSTIRSKVQEYRINAACYLLSYTDKSVSEVASLVGYEDESYFIEFFKRVRHITPYQYKKNPALQDSPPVTP